jgi:6-phosphogluconolactonase
MVYRFDSRTGKLAPADKPWYQAAPGAGPRHFTFTADGKQAFAVNELNSSVTFFSFDQERGLLDELQTLSTLPVDFTAENTCADLHIHPNGKFLYASNRGLDSIAVFSIGNGSGKIKLIQNQSALGKTPRNFTIHPSGNFILVANQDSGSIQVFSLDPDKGLLAETGKSISVNTPVCLLL